MRPSGQELIAEATAVLRGNDVGEYTKPSPRLYPHQWNWDSAFIAIGLARVDWDRTVRELDALVAGQWTDGMIPHIRYNPAVADYHPGPEWWPSPRVKRAGEVTSGISQPPLLPTAVLLAGSVQPDPLVRLAWWRRLYEPLRDFLLYFVRHRTLPGSPLIAVIHPWESGLDNSPRWDYATRAGLQPSKPYRRVDDAIVGADQRPRKADYDLYMFLVEQIASSGYEMSSYLPGAPFAVYDALFNAVWFRAAHDLNLMAEALGRPPALSPVDLEAFRDAYGEALWYEPSGLFRDFDLRARSQIPVDTVAGLAAIYGGLVDAGRAVTMLERYMGRCEGCRLVPSVAADEPGFDPRRYWRGPVWMNTNWLLIRGLESLGLATEAARLADSTLDLTRAGLHEYYDPLTGEGLGGPCFSWTAALTIDLVSRFS